MITGLLRGCPSGLQLFSMLLLSACASMDATSPVQYQSERARDYPVTIVAAEFAPAVDVPLRLRGRGKGALLGAGEGVAHCGEAVFGAAGGAAHPAIAGLAALFCVTVAALVGGVAGAVTAEPADTSLTARVRLEQHAARIEPQRALADSVRAYLEQFPGAVVLSDAPQGPASPQELPRYPNRGARGAGSLVELRLLGFVFGGSGRKDQPLCLDFSLRARKIEADTGQPSDDMHLRQSIGCFPVADWLTQEDGRIATALASAYRRAAEDIVDEFYLVYRPPPSTNPAPAPRSVVPAYVLAPVRPAPPEVYLDIDLFPSRKDLQGFGGMHFRDLESFSPEFAWEPFPRAAETAAEGASAFTEISYDLRLFRGDRAGVAVAPSEMIHEVRGLVEPSFRLGEALQPCSWYFWTVRARFRLHGSWRTTEWTGAYHTAGGHYSPSAARRNFGSTLGFVWPARYLYLPLRTPGADRTAACWQAG